MILDNLRKAGVQNTVKDERLKFDRLDPFAGDVDSGRRATYTDADGKTQARRRLASAPSTARSARTGQGGGQGSGQGVGFDLLIVCGFAFDPHVTEEAKRYGKLTVLPARMNPDLAMGDELLKKTGAGNLFMVFGEPDIEIDTQTRRQARRRDPRLDVYDPTTGEIRSQLDRRHRLLVHRHRLQRRELLRPPRLLHRRRRALRQAEARPARRDRRSRLGDALQHHEPAVPTPETGKIAVKVI